MSECAVLTIALASLAQPALARTHLNCSARKVVLISAPAGDTSSAREEDLSFWIDDEAKTLTFLDNTPLTVTRLDRFWISANRDGVFLTSSIAEMVPCPMQVRQQRTAFRPPSWGRAGVGLRLLRCGEDVSHPSAKTPGAIFVCDGHVGPTPITGKLERVPLDSMHRCRGLGVLPSPLWGGVGGGGRCYWTKLTQQLRPPTRPPPLRFGAKPMLCIGVLRAKNGGRRPPIPRHKGPQGGG